MPIRTWQARIAKFLNSSKSVKCYTLISENTSLYMYSNQWKSRVTVGKATTTPPMAAQIAAASWAKIPKVAAAKRPLSKSLPIHVYSRNPHNSALISFFNLHNSLLMMEPLCNARTTPMLQNTRDKATSLQNTNADGRHPYLYPRNHDLEPVKIVEAGPLLLHDELPSPGALFPLRVHIYRSSNDTHGSKSYGTAMDGIET